MRPVQRMVDAAANRALEGARVLEDIARFCMDDGELAGAFKCVRHELARVVDGACGGGRSAARDVEQDVGARPSRAAAPPRQGVVELARANASRLGEALRSVEEGLKACGAGDAAAAWTAVESLRYRAYTLCATLLARLGPVTARPWRVCLVLSESLCLRPWQEVVDGALSGGVECIQLREKDLAGAALVERARELLARAAAAGATVIVNDRVDVAIAAGAHGVHLGREDISIGAARRMAGGMLLVGATVHDGAEAEAAVAAGADYCGVGAMFASAVKPAQVPAGAAWMREFSLRWPTVPHLAIGGITAARIGELRAAGCRGVAVSTAICGARDPESAARELCALLSPDAPHCRDEQCLGA